jgi:hypothetical protein
MGLPWIRLDTSMPDNPKILRLLDYRDGHRAAFVWLCCLTYSGKHGTDGFIPKNAGPFVHGKSTDFARLVAVEALKVVPGGWEIPGWGEFQESSDASKLRRERAQRAAAIRWSKDEIASARRKKDGA